MRYPGIAAAMALTDSGDGVTREARAFPDTPWSALCRLRDGGDARHREDLERLIALYWKPVYGVLRQFWTRDDEQAQDLTQSFFTNVVLDGPLLAVPDAQRGSFRKLLKTALANFARNQARDAARHKRGGGRSVISFDGDAANLRELLPDAGTLQPDEAFDLLWAQVVLARAVELLEARLVAEGRTHYLEVFRRYDLAGEGVEASYAEVGASLGLPPAQVKRGLTQARALLRDLVVEVVRGYVGGPQALADELATLFGR